MKRIKIMLLSLSILAVVGGALAFTAKNGKQICTADLDENGACNIACPSPRLTSAVPTTVFICTAPTAASDFSPCHPTQGTTVQCANKVLQSVE